MDIGIYIFSNYHTIFINLAVKINERQDEKRVESFLVELIFINSNRSRFIKTWCNISLLCFCLKS